MFGELSKTEKQGADNLDAGDEEFESEPRDNINETAEVDPLDEFVSEDDDVRTLDDREESESKPGNNRNYPTGAPNR